MAKAIPDRWTDYKPIGKKIEGTRFIAFKVPLKEDVSKTVDTYNRLDERILLRSIPTLGLIIDLTNTYRYYSPAGFRDVGIMYEKLMIPGREIPKKNFSDKFVWIVNEFMKKNKDNGKLIGVHCTHGVNRTGYMICNYMITEMNIKPKEAIDMFQNARGHKIERDIYVEALNKLTKKTDRKNLKKITQSDNQPHNWRQKVDATNNTSFHSEHSNRSGSSSYKRPASSNWRQNPDQKINKRYHTEYPHRSGSSNYKHCDNNYSNRHSPYDRSGYYYKSRRNDSSHPKLSDHNTTPPSIPNTNKKVD